MRSAGRRGGVLRRRWPVRRRWSRDVATGQGASADVLQDEAAAGQGPPAPRGVRATRLDGAGGCQTGVVFEPASRHGSAPFFLVLTASRPRRCASPRWSCRDTTPPDRQPAAHLRQHRPGTPDCGVRQGRRPEPTRACRNAPHRPPLTASQPLEPIGVPRHPGRHRDGDAAAVRQPDRDRRGGRPARARMITARQDGELAVLRARGGSLRLAAVSAELAALVRP